MFKLWKNFIDFQYISSKQYCTFRAAVHTELFTNAANSSKLFIYHICLNFATIIDI